MQTRKRNRRLWLAAGLCYDCGAARDNKTIRCEACRVAHNARGHATYIEVRDAGCCPNCGATPAPGKVYCAECRKKISRATSARYDRLVKQGRCAWCAKPHNRIIHPGKVNGRRQRARRAAYCQACADRLAELKKIARKRSRDDLTHAVASGSLPTQQEPTYPHESQETPAPQEARIPPGALTDP